MEGNLYEFDFEPHRPKQRKSVQQHIEIIHYKMSQFDKTFEKLEKKLEKVSKVIDQMLDKPQLIQAPLDQSKVTAQKLIAASGSRMDNHAPELGQSRAHSVQASAASSRPGSPEQLREGIYPVLKNIAYSNKVILKGDHEKYPEALHGLRNVISEKGGILKRIRNDLENTAAQAKAEISQVMPCAMGLMPMQPRKMYVFSVIPEQLKNVSLGAAVRKELMKEFPKISKSCSNLRFIIEAIHARYNGHLSASQIKDAIISMCLGEFRDNISECLGRMEINDGIKFIVSMYCELDSVSQKLAEFHKVRINMKDPILSLKRILQLAYECYPDYNMHQLTEVAISKALAHLPSKVVEAVSESRQRLNELKEFYPHIEPMDYSTFISVVEKNLVKNPQGEFQGINEEPESETESNSQESPDSDSESDSESNSNHSGEATDQSRAQSDAEADKNDGGNDGD